MNPSQSTFVKSSIRRKKLFLGLSLLGVLAGLGLGIYWFFFSPGEPDAPNGLRAVLVVMILLNARQNLRQYRYALALEALCRPRPAA